MLSKKLKQNLSNYCEYKEQQTYNLLVNLKTIQLGNSKQNVSYLNQELQNIIQCGFYDIVSRDDIYDLCSLIRILCKSLHNNPNMQARSLIFLLESSVQILSGDNLNKIMEQVIKYQKILVQSKQSDKHRLHRILNQALKKIHKSNRNSILRGKLHIFLSNLLKFGHKSGIIECLYQVQPYKEKVKRSYDQFITFFKDANLSFEFYQKYCQIYNALLINDSTKTLSHVLPNNYQKILLNKLSQFLSNLQSLTLHFNSLPPQALPCLSSVPLTLPHPTCLSPNPYNFIKQCHTAQFRLLLFLKTLLYFHDLKQKINKNHHIKQQQISHILYMVKCIEEICATEIRKLVRDQGSGEVETMLGYFLVNQKKWEQIKAGNIRNIVKVLKSGEKVQAGMNISVSTNSQKSVSVAAQTIVSQQQTISFHEAAYRSQIQSKLCLNPTKMQHYLSNPSSINITKHKLPPQQCQSEHNNQMVINLAQNWQQPYEINNIRVSYSMESEQQLNIIKWKTMRNVMRSKLAALVDSKFVKMFINYGVYGSQEEKYKSCEATQVE